MTFMKDREADLQDSPVAVEPVDVDDFSPEARASILGILVTLGDNKYRFGRRLGDWATSGPTLEASVATASMTSDEMGHARSLYPLLRKFPGAPPELKREHDRTEFHNVSFLDRPFETWADLIAVAALFDRAMSTLVESMRDSAYGPFRHRAAKILQEEKYHRLYADGWVETLAWFGPDDDPVLTVATDERIVAASGPELRARFVESVRRLVDPIAELGFPADAPLPWDRWDPRSRRLP